MNLLTTPIRRSRAVVRLAAVAVGGSVGVLVSSLPAHATGTSTGATGYGYGYGYGYGSTASNLLHTALNTQTVVAAIPAGALLAGALLWERRGSKRSAAVHLDG